MHQGGLLAGEIAGGGGLDSDRDPVGVGADHVRLAPTVTDLTAAVAARSMQMMASPAPTLSAARLIPSRTRWGEPARSALSLPLAGSPSVPLATTMLRRAAATAAQFGGGREAGAAAAAQTGPFDLVDQHRAAGGHRPPPPEMGVQARTVGPGEQPGQRARVGHDGTDGGGGPAGGLMRSPGWCR